MHLDGVKLIEYVIWICVSVFVWFPSEFRQLLLLHSTRQSCWERERQWETRCCYIILFVCSLYLCICLFSFCLYSFSLILHLPIFSHCVCSVFPQSETTECVLWICVSVFVWFSSVAVTTKVMDSIYFVLVLMFVGLCCAVMSYIQENEGNRYWQNEGNR